MPRPRTVPDEQLLDAALEIVHRDGPENLTFAALAANVGLAGSTLVQRFGTKAQLLRAALLRAWERLEETTGAVLADTPPGPEGVIDLFVALTAATDEDEYAEQLPVLREDLRDPMLRQRGKKWLTTLADAVEIRLDGIPPGTGRLVVAHWQGTLTVWAFTREGRLDEAVREALSQLLACIARPAKPSSGSQRR